MARTRYRPESYRVRIAHRVLDDLDVDLYLNHGPEATDALRWLARRFAERPGHPVPFLRGLLSISATPHQPEDPKP